jgi:hypothetical protein
MAISQIAIVVKDIRASMKAYLDPPSDSIGE